MKAKNSQPSQDPTADQNTVPKRPGFHINVMPVLSKDGNYVRFFLGDMTVTEHANRFKGLLGMEYEKREFSERTPEFTPRVGLHAKVRVFLSQDREWVSVVLPGNLGRISNHVNAYKYIFKIPYEKKGAKAAA
ncbi:MAG: hypothetical protein JST16_05445 [Bdellovibrionales bacterium]|nr:hypothetical protein [Bdellovibrionales bacterium]